jgi:hypothetical protein
MEGVCVLGSRTWIWQTDAPAWQLSTALSAISLGVIGGWGDFSRVVRPPMIATVTINLSIFSSLHYKIRSNFDGLIFYGRNRLKKIDEKK